MTDCVQDPVHPSKLYNHDNECAPCHLQGNIAVLMPYCRIHGCDVRLPLVNHQPSADPSVTCIAQHCSVHRYLHYEDDWYVVSWRPEEYAFIYYKGNNDAWLGYGGATVYTRAAQFPKEYEPEMRKAAEAVGLKWADFTITDNSCPDHPAKKPFPFNLFQSAQQLEASLVREFEQDLQSFGRGFTVLETGTIAHPP